MWAAWLLKELIYKGDLLEYSKYSAFIFAGWSPVLQVCVRVSADQRGGGREWGQWQQTGFQWWQPLQTQQWHCWCESGPAPDFASLPLAFGCPWQVLCVCVVLCIEAPQFPPKPFLYEKIFIGKKISLFYWTGDRDWERINLGVLSRIRLSWH